MTDTDDHKTKMQDMQAKQREKVAELADPEKGLVLVHTGNGKGKSSSAFGVIMAHDGRRLYLGHPGQGPRHRCSKSSLCQGARDDGKRRL